MNAREVLEILRRTEALLSGHFELRSGLHSDQYFQCAMVLQHPREAELLARALAARIREKLGAGAVVDAVISPAMGGLIIGHELGRALGVRAIFAEKQEGTLVLRRGFAILRGERFVVAEDVVTRGGRVSETVKIVKDRGGEVVAVGTLVDRSEKKAAFGCPLVSLLEMAPVTYDPATCPLCASGSRAVHPGS